MLRQSYNIDFSVHMSLMKFSVLWLRILFSPVVCVYRALCIMHSARYTRTTRALIGRIKDLILSTCTVEP